MKHGNAGRKSNRARSVKERSKIVKPVREKYGGDEKKRFGPTSAAEHLAREDQLEVHPETPQAKGSGAGQRDTLGPAGEEDGAPEDRHA